jgi:hypothetical protein
MKYNTWLYFEAPEGPESEYNFLMYLCDHGSHLESLVIMINDGDTIIHNPHVNKENMENFLEETYIVSIADDISEDEQQYYFRHIFENEDVR